MAKRRITPDELKQAYEKTGLKPVQGCYFEIDNNQRCGCGIGAMTLFLVPDLLDGITEPNTVGRVVGNKSEDLFDLKYQLGYFAGFDGDRLDPEESDDEDYCLGYADGVACATAVIPDFATQTEPKGWDSV